MTHLIDMSNLAWRSHFAFKQMSWAQGPTGVLFGFLKAIRSLRVTAKAQDIICCFDNGIPAGHVKHIPSWRKAVFPEYKASRKHETEDLHAVLGQLSLLGKRLIPALGLHSVGYPGLEADDVIGIFSQTIDPVLIYSSDRDFYQLLTADGRVQIISPARQIDYTYVVKKFEITPEQWAAYLAMGGDSSDDIKPARGMGPKTAIKLVKAGVDPALPWNKQSAAMRFSILNEAVWKRVMAAYQVAKLPRSFSDLPKTTVARHGFGIRTTLSALPMPDPAAFERFCADYELNDAFANRREYFK